MNDQGFDDESQLPPPTVPENLSLNLQGFASREDAERLGHVLANTVRDISRYIDVSRLDGISVAFDYNAALAQLDRGYQSSRPLSRTSDDLNIGVAMTPAVLRAGVVKAHIVLCAPLVLPLEWPSDDHYEYAFYIVAHECGHVEDLKIRDVCFPRTILQREITNQEEAVLDWFAGGLWEEYSACRSSAVFGKTQMASYEKCFTNVLPSARERANAAIRSYRTHRSVDRVLEEAGSQLCAPLRYASYLLGDLDGRKASLDEAPRARDMLSGNPYEASINRLRDTLRSLWSRRGQWVSASEFEPLGAIVRDLLADGGLILRPLPDGSLHVNIPYKPETMP